MNSHDLLVLERVPVYQNRAYDTRDEAIGCMRGDVRLAQDAMTGIVRNRAFDSHAIQYDDAYQNEQAHSPSFQAHLEEVLDLVSGQFGGTRILEVGCGKGTFVHLLRSAGQDAYGIDPAYEGTSEHIIKRHFDASVDMHVDSLVLRHVLEHIESPLQFLAAIAAANGGRGLIYIEVPCLDWILRNNAWFDVFYEHVNYFRLADFRRLFSRVLAAGHLFGGQYLYVIADLASLSQPGPDDPGDDIAAIPPGFLAGLDVSAQLAARPGAKAIWGGAAKGVMFAHHMRSRGVHLDLAIDINPGKQGRFMAGSGLPILAPEQGLRQLGGSADIFVMNSNYLPEIVAMGGPSFNYIAVDRT